MSVSPSYTLEVKLAEMCTVKLHFCTKKVEVNDTGFSALMIHEFGVWNLSLFWFTSFSESSGSISFLLTARGRCFSTGYLHLTYVQVEFGACALPHHMVTGDFVGIIT